MMITGDAMARPLIETLAGGPRPLGPLVAVRDVVERRGVLARRSRTPCSSCCRTSWSIDAIGSSESGMNGMVIQTKGQTANHGGGGPTVKAGRDAVVLDDDLRAARARHRRGRQARPRRQHPDRVLQGPGQDGGHLRARPRRHPLRGGRRLRPPRGRRHHHPARAGARSASTPAARRSSPRRSSRSSRATRRCTTCSSSASPTSAGARPSAPSSSPATARPPPTLDRARRPLPHPAGRLQDAPPPGAGRRDPALPQRQARLPLGRRGGQGRRHAPAPSPRRSTVGGPDRRPTADRRTAAHVRPSHVTDPLGTVVPTTAGSGKAPLP